jgi:hypothetical protein
MRDTPSSTDNAWSGFDWPAGWTPGPLHEQPRSVYPPYTCRRFAFGESRLERAVALVHALGGVELGAYDARTLQWLAGRDVATVATLAVLIRRARLAGPALCQPIKLDR